jgi:hypothetical protein
MQLFGLTVAALLRASGESVTGLAGVLGMSQSAVSKKLHGASAWNFNDLDKVSRHFNIAVPDLVCGPTHAVGLLPRNRRAAVIGGTQPVLAVV